MVMQFWCDGWGVECGVVGVWGVVGDAVVCVGG